MFSSIRSRILAITTLLVAIAFLITGTAIYLIVRSNEEQNIKQSLEFITEGNALAIDEWVAGKQAAVAAAVIAAHSGDPQAAVSQLQKTGGFKVATLGLDDKSAFGMPPPKPDFDPTSRPWYKETQQAGKPLVTKPYADIATKKPMVSFASPVQRESGPNGVLSAAMLLEGVRQVVVSIHPTPASFGFVVDGNGTLLAHPDEKFGSRPISDLSPDLTPATAVALAQAKTPLEAALQGASKLMLSRQIKGTDWYLVVALDKAESHVGLYQVLKTIIGSIVLVLIATIAVLGMVLTAAFRRLSGVTSAMDEISSGSGDLTVRLHATGKDEVARIAGAFNVFVDKINGILLQVRDGSTAIRSATAEIASGNADLSARTETQASSLEETAASMEQLTSTVTQNAENAHQANALVASASSLASKGGAVVGEVVNTMNSIKASSAKIVEIIAVIDGIAFQTNILALNAAVEAARAGEQGRGFAVVASEVRSLAQRAASAAKDINLLISDTVHKVDAGNTLVEAAGHTMREIVDSVQRVAIIMGEITTASHEQSAGIGETNQAIAQMDQMTQQNAALVEQAAAAAESLGEQAALLSETVAVFKLNQGAGAALPGVVHAQPPGARQRLASQGMGRLARSS